MNSLALATPFRARRTAGSRFALVALVGAALSTVPSILSAASTAKIEPVAIDAIFAEWNKPTTPGVALAVIHEGAIVYERGYGQANIERKVAITPQTAFYIGSVSKQFTAAAIALLAQRKVISLDDDVRKYVPELPDYGTPVTIRQCVHHTSGLRDYLALRALAGEPVNATFTDDDVLALIRRQKALNFPPGTGHLYSNSGYFVLSLIVKRTTGKSLRDFAAENFFGPLGMKTAQYRDKHTHPIPNRAEGYAALGNGYRVSNPNFDVVGAGGVFMTVRDFLAWDRNFYDAKIGGADFVAQLQTPGLLNNGTDTRYAFGLTVGQYRGLKVVEHSGAYGGFKAHVIRFPNQRLSVVCFTNLGAMTPGVLVRKVADACLAGAFPSAATVAASTSAPSATVDAAGAVLTETQAGNGKAGKASQGGKTQKSPPAAPTALTPAEAARFAGTYRSDELNVAYQIVAEASSGALKLERRGNPTASLTPEAANTFATSGLKLRFNRDERGNIASFSLEAGRVRDLAFTRQ
ncbi:MAG: serine hydrolase domain-containing protein [Verrucomicrobiota bacterium]